MERTPNLRFAALAFCVLAALAGCKQEETKPTVQSQQRSRLEAVQGAEMQREAQQRQAQQDQPPPSPTSAQTPGSEATSSGAGTGGQQAPSAQPYLPPSEQGAYVEMTETPAGMQPPAPQAPGAAAPAGGAPSAQSAGPASGGDAGGNMPQAAASPVQAGTAGSPPPAGSGGMRSAPAAPPAMQGASAPIPRGAEQVGALNSELERKLREFDELMKRAQIEADKERAAIAAGGGRSSGERDGRGGRLDAPPEDFGAGGAAEESSGLGASPDLSGETGAIDERFGGPSPVRMEPAGDDDIVARQLREAAERETDPVLREKLWAEYRNYKGQ